MSFNYAKEVSKRKTATWGMAIIAAAVLGANVLAGFDSEAIDPEVLNKGSVLGLVLAVLLGIKASVHNIKIRSWVFGGHRN
ncbi:MAG: hypothetical protein AAB955_03270 [Patescibacteria group bacterium]